MSTLLQRSAGAVRRGPALAVLCLAVLIAQIDTSVVNLALHGIGADLGGSIPALQWVVDGYNLTYALLLLTGGTLGDLFGRRRVFVIGAAVFTVGSALCGLAPAMPVLLAGRVVAGLGAALLLPCSLALIRVIWTDPVARGRAIGVWAGCNGAAFAIGPTIGGVLIQHAGWRSVFLLIIPFGALALILARLVIPESSDPKGRRIDLPGQALAALALGGLSLGVIAHGEIALAARWIAGAGFIAFLAVERRLGAAALVPLSIFRSAAFSGAMAAAAAMTFGMYGVLFLLPMSWQASGVLSVTQAGFALLPMSLVFVALSPMASRLAHRFGPRIVMAGGMALIGAGLLVLGLTRQGAPVPLAEVGLTLTGIGMGLNTGPLFNVAVASVDAARSGTASALINTARMVGATLGVAVLGTLFGAMGGGAAGMRAAMLAGGAVELAGAMAAVLLVRTA
ncbi:MAG TPA: MFS transporter [Acetobacteraceae bacterium]|nr:MFS transporter [Acetobacteraceae bacterium]